MGRHLRVSPLETGGARLPGRACRLAAWLLPIVLLVAHPTAAAGKDQRYAMRGMVMRVAPSHQSFVVSHDSVAGVMPAMTMSFDVRDPKEVEPLAPGMTVEFILVVGHESAHAEQIHIRRYETVEQDPLTAQRLRLLKRLTGAPSSTIKALAIGDRVPDFTLIDQARHAVTLSELQGKLVAINFIYTSCALPQFCFRIANHFGVVQKRFKNRIGRELVLLTVTFDPVRDQPERLAEYARQWKADPASWHFLTGAVTAIKRVCELFGVEFFQDEGLMTHSSHTAVIDRHGHLAANIEGNQFTAAQLGDLIEATLNR